MTFGSLFAGIGGIDLGLERAGMTCCWQVENDPYANRVLAKHWPNVRRHGDVRTFPPTEASEWSVDLIAGGFPCQPISNDGHQLVEQDSRWLWPEFARIIRILRPRFAFLENVSALLVRGMGSILGELAASGFDAEWQSIPASAFGAPHQRSRVFIVAYPNSVGCEESERVFAGRSVEGLLQPWSSSIFHRSTCGRVRLLPDSETYRMGHGVSGDLDGIRGLGNAVVPQVAEWIGKRLMEAINEPV